MTANRELFEVVSTHPEYLRGFNSRNEEVNALKKRIAELEKLPANKHRKGSDALRVRIGKMLGRRPTTKWSPSELKHLKALGEPEELEILLMEEFYGVEEDPDEPLFRRTSIERILKYWPSECDKARDWKRRQKK